MHHCGDLSITKVVQYFRRPFLVAVRGTLLRTSSARQYLVTRPRRMIWLYRAIIKQYVDVEESTLLLNFFMSKQMSLVAKGNRFNSDTSYYSKGCCSPKIALTESASYSISFEIPPYCSSVRRSDGRLRQASVEWVERKKERGDV